MYDIEHQPGRFCASSSTHWVYVGGNSIDREVVTSADHLGGIPYRGSIRGCVGSGSGERA